MRLIKLAILFFTLFAIGLIVLASANDDETPNYKLTNSADPSLEGIATNSRIIGRRLPNTELTNVNGRKVSTREIIGTPQIINIWYSTCEPCRREMPILSKGADKFSGQVRFTGINIKDSAKVAKEFAEKYGVSFDLLLDTNGEFISDLGIGTAPVTLAVDAQGKIVNQVAGEIDATKLDELVKELMK